MDTSFCHGATGTISRPNATGARISVQGATMQPPNVVDVGLFITEWSKCLTAKHQRDQLYRFGKFDDCSRQWNDLKHVAYAKFSEEDAARKIVQATYHYQRSTISPTVGVIWELKETPGWN